MYYSGLGTGYNVYLPGAGLATTRRLTGDRARTAGLYFLTAIQVLYFYEYMVALSREVEHVWSHKATGANILFLLNRYLSFVYCIFQIVVENDTQMPCQVWLHHRLHRWSSELFSFTELLRHSASSKWTIDFLIHPLGSLLGTSRLCNKLWGQTCVIPYPCAWPSSSRHKYLQLTQIVADHLPPYGCNPSSCYPLLFRIGGYLEFTAHTIINLNLCEYIRDCYASVRHCSRCYRATRHLAYDILRQSSCQGGERASLLNEIITEG
ncbi:hypothetical protein AcV7_005675 [Taiwanofungus camphoratus]|nr:hypothetical protein AcV7_005675 [Antrodia cinnamomea]